MGWKKTKGDLGAFGSAFRIFSRFAERKSGEGTQANDRLNEAGLPGAIGPDHEIERRQGKVRAAQRLEIPESDGGDHGQSVRGRPAEFNVKIRRAISRSRRSTARSVSAWLARS